MAIRDNFPRTRGIFMSREIITFECTECKRRNYTSMKEKRNTPGRLEKSKYCKWERKHTLHRERSK
jgi:large subunit ribosomal protein L33